MGRLDLGRREGMKLKNTDEILIVKKDDNEVIASITEKDVIEKEDYKVSFIKYKKAKRTFWSIRPNH